MQLMTIAGCVRHLRAVVCRAKCDQQRNRLCAIYFASWFWDSVRARHSAIAETAAPPKPRKKKQKRYDSSCAVLIVHRFPETYLCT
jgi:hypothetical protein